MSGNSKDCRTAKRFVERIVAERIFGFHILPEQATLSMEQKIWSWPVLGVAVPSLWAIGAVLMSAPLIIPDICFAAGSILLLVKFFTWPEFWRQTKRVKLRSSAIVVAAAVLPMYALIEINHRTPTFPFPWVSTANQSSEGMGVQIFVRDYPLDPGLNTVGSSASLFHVNILISKVVSISKEGEAWHEEGIAYVNKEEWSNALDNQTLAWLPLKNQTTVLEFQGTSRDANWDGYIVLRREKGQIQRFQSMRGTVIFPRTKGKLALTEELNTDDSGIHKLIPHEFQPLTKKRLLEYGIPES
jgi:hypothetical protein